MLGGGVEDVRGNKWREIRRSEEGNVGELMGNVGQ